MYGMPLCLYVVFRTKAHRKYLNVLNLPFQVNPGCFLNICNFRTRIYHACISPNSFYFLFLCFLSKHKYQYLNIMLRVPLQPSAFLQRNTSFYVSPFFPSCFASSFDSSPCHWIDLCLEIYHIVFLYSFGTIDIWTQFIITRKHHLKDNCNANHVHIKYHCMHQPRKFLFYSSVPICVHTEIYRRILYFDSWSQENRKLEKLGLLTKKEEEEEWKTWAGVKEVKVGNITMLLKPAMWNTGNLLT